MDKKKEARYQNELAEMEKELLAIQGMLNAHQADLDMMCAPDTTAKAAPRQAIKGGRNGMVIGRRSAADSAGSTPASL